MGGGVARLLLSVVGVFFFALAIVALVARDQRQTFAIGFIIPFATYIGIHYLSEQNELDPYRSNALITTQSFRPVYSAIAKRVWKHPTTGKILSNFDLDTTGWTEPPSPGPALVYADRTGTPGTLTERPDRKTFMLVAHCLVASVLGYVGGRFAVHIRKTDTKLAA